MTDFVQDADIWPTLREEAQRDAEQEPCLAGFLYESVLRHPTLIDALGGLLSHKLASETMSSMTLLALAQEAFCREPQIEGAVIADLQAIIHRDPATRGYSQPLLYAKGFHAVQAYRIAHHFWITERHALAQDEREEHERAEETGDHERIPARMTERGFEGERPGDLTEDRAGEEYPLLHHSTFERSWVGPRPLTGTQTIQATYQMV